MIEEYYAEQGIDLSTYGEVHDRLLQDLNNLTLAVWILSDRFC